jgi:hypothetical protein
MTSIEANEATVAALAVPRVPAVRCSFEQQLLEMPRLQARTPLTEAFRLLAAQLGVTGACSRVPLQMMPPRSPIVRLP